LVCFKEANYVWALSRAVTVDQVRCSIGAVYFVAFARFFVPYAAFFYLAAAVTIS
jgi:hypothetical protein